jgi:hypothetical protein
MSEKAKKRKCLVSGWNKYQKQKRGEHQHLKEKSIHLTQLKKCQKKK